jgi:hypothetical protein
MSARLSMSRIAVDRAAPALLGAAYHLMASAISE